MDARTICFKGSGEMIGAEVLSTGAPFYHTLDFDAFWTRRENFAYVGRLAVLPKFHSQGIGKALLHLAELIWQRQGGTSLRLDLNCQADCLSSLYLKSEISV